MRSYSDKDADYLEPTYFDDLSEKRAWAALRAAKSKPTPLAPIEALEDIAYDCASLDDAQEIARKALREAKQ